MRFILVLTQGDYNRQQKKSNDSDSQHCMPSTSIAVHIHLDRFTPFQYCQFCFSIHPINSFHLRAIRCRIIIGLLSYRLVVVFFVSCYDNNICNHYSHHIRIIACSSFANPSQFDNCRKTKMCRRCIDVSMAALWCVLRPRSGHVAMA